MRVSPGAGQILTKKTITEVRQDVRAEFRRWGMSPDEYEIWPKGDNDGAQIDFWRDGKKQTVRCAKTRDFALNLYALWRVIEALRLAQQRGILDTLVMAGLAMLPAGAALVDPYEVLGVRPDAQLSVIEGAYRARAHDLHPDKGGDTEAMKGLNDALARVKAERGIA